MLNYNKNMLDSHYSENIIKKKGNNNKRQF